MIKTKAIVISSLKYQETSLIVKCYTQETGMQSYLLKGILKNNKNGLKSAYFQPLMQLDMIASCRKKGALEYIKEVKINYHYQRMYVDMVKNAVAFFLSEISYAILTEEYKDEQLFTFFEKYLQWYDNSALSANFHLKFLIDLTQFLGFFPDMLSSRNHYFDVEEGIFVQEQNGHYLLDKVNTEIFKAFIFRELNEIDTIYLHREQRNKLLEAILKYYQWHLPNFHIPKSWEILRTIFN